MRNNYLRSLAVAGAFVCLSAVCAFSQNLITNGGFETGNFNGWTQIGDTSYSGVCVSNEDTPECSGRNVFAGQWMGDFGAIYTLGGVKQTVATIPGQTYELSFWMQSGYSPPPNAVDITFDGVTVLAAADMGHIFWTQFTFTKVVSGTSADVVFQFYSIPDYFDLDDVNVKAVETPEPTTLLLLSSSIVGLGWWKRQR